MAVALWDYFVVPTKLFLSQRSLRPSQGTNTDLETITTTIFVEQASALYVRTAQ